MLLSSHLTSKPARHNRWRNDPFRACARAKCRSRNAHCDCKNGNRIRHADATANRYYFCDFAPRTAAIHNQLPWPHQSRISSRFSVRRDGAFLNNQIRRTDVFIWNPRAPLCAQEATTAHNTSNEKALSRIIAPRSSIFEIATSFYKCYELWRRKYRLLYKMLE